MTKFQIPKEIPTPKLQRPGVAIWRLTILFSTGHFGFLRNFESTLRLLGERGHRVHLVADRRDQTDGQRMVDALTSAYPTFSSEVLPFSKQRLWYPLASGLRASLDYWRYLRPEY